MLPSFRTPRLLLRPLHLADAPAMQRFAGDPDVSRKLSRVPHPYPDGEARAFIAEVLGGDATDIRPFAVEADGSFAGVVVLSDPLCFQAGTATLGYWYGKPFWGRGYASEAAAGVLGRYAFAALGAREVLAGAFVDNPASIRVLEKLGFERIGVSEKFSLARGHCSTHLDMRLTPEGFAARLETAAA